MSAIKMRCVDLILIYFIGTATCRPQNSENIEARAIQADPGVEIERQHVEHVAPIDEPGRFAPDNLQQPHRNIDASTRDILDKIAQVNKQQGLTAKKKKPNYFHFPYSFSRSHDDQKLNNFKFPRDPFTNPIFDYLEKGHFKSEKNRAIFRKTSNDKPDTINPEVLKDDQENQYIRRKITHYQSVMMPNPYLMDMYMRPASSQFTLLPMQVADIPYGASANSFMPPDFPIPKIPNRSENKLSNVDGNVRNVFQDNAHLAQPNPSLINTRDGQPHRMHQTQTFPMYSQLYPVMPSDSSSKARQNWNWPGANLFPIYIRDPFLQMYYAFTNMVEYGPNSGNEGPCKLTPRPQGSRIKVNSKTSPIGNGKDQHISLQINKAKGSEQDIIVTDVAADGADYLDLDDIDVGDHDLVKFTVNLPKSKHGTESRGLADKTEKMTWQDFMRIRNNSQLSSLASGQLDFRPANESKNQQSVIIKNPIVSTEELEDDIESEKAEEINVENENSRRVFSSDNTGSGIFIRRLKVRKGGVAIAGPGGIATAGSGGTAIVGPDGIAYTHPHGLAIAGSGSKVVAVDPSIDLNDVIKDSVLNGTKHLPNTRLGKVVAVGPVVYYNEG